MRQANINVNTNEDGTVSYSVSFFTDNKAESDSVYNDIVTKYMSEETKATTAKKK